MKHAMKKCRTCGQAGHDSKHCGIALASKVDRLSIRELRADLAAADRRYERAFRKILRVIRELGITE